MEIILISTQHKTPLSSFPEASPHPDRRENLSKRPPEKRKSGAPVRSDGKRKGEPAKQNRWLHTRNATLGFLKFGRNSSPTADPSGTRSMQGDSFSSNVMTKANAARAGNSLCSDAIGTTAFRNDQSHLRPCRNRSWPAGHHPRQ